MTELTADIPPASPWTAAPPAETEAGCPPPLDWQQVLAAVTSQSRRFHFAASTVHTTATVFGAGAPVYLIPSFFGTHQLFALTAWLLREECCCVMIDQQTAPAAPRQTAEQMLSVLAEGVTAVADALGHERLRLHAAGFGGLTALRALLEHPQRIAAATLQGGFAQWRMSLAERTVTALACRSKRLLREVAPAMRIQEQNHRGWFPPFDETRWRFYRNNVAETPVAESARRATLAQQVDWHGRLAQIEAPVLLIGAEGDGRVATEAQHLLAAKLPHCRREFIDNCGRLPHVTHPHRLVKLLRAFWEQIDDDT